jgi:hypothetical protein
MGEGYSLSTQSAERSMEDLKTMNKPGVVEPNHTFAVAELANRAPYRRAVEAAIWGIFWSNPNTPAKGRS